MVFRLFVAALAAVGLCGTAVAQPEAAPIRLARLAFFSVRLGKGCAVPRLKPRAWKRAACLRMC
jgi:hypothetical protein